MTTTRNASRNQRNNPYILDGYAASFHRSAAGVAWRWRTELIDPDRARRRAAAAQPHPHPHRRRHHPRRAHPGASWPCPARAGS